MVIPKRLAVALSLASFISSTLIGLFTLSLITLDNPFNIIEDAVTGMKMAAVLVVLQCILSRLICYLYLHQGYTGFLEKDNLGATIGNFLKSCILLLASSFLFHFIALCFGAPFLSGTDVTYTFAVLMTVLVCLPCCLVAGSDLDRWMDIFTFTGDVSEDTVVYFTSVCSLLGSWLGAIPIPLDWDRPWQEWPKSCAIGALAGYSIGLFVASIYLPRRYKAGCKSKFT